MEPVYQSTASIRIDARPDAAIATAMYGLPSDNVNLVATAIEELSSRSLSNDVADSLGLRLVVGEPARTPRSAVLAWAKVDADAPLRAYRLTAFGDKQVNVQELGGRAIGRFPLAGTVAVPGATFRLAESALAQGAAVVQVVSLEAAAAAVRARTQVNQPNLNANIVTVTYEGNDPVMVREVANVLAARFVRKRLEAEKAGARTTVVLPPPAARHARPRDAPARGRGEQLPAGQQDHQRGERSRAAHGGDPAAAGSTRLGGDRPRRAPRLARPPAPQQRRRRPARLRAAALGARRSRASSTRRARARSRSSGCASRRTTAPPCSAGSARTIPT
jgi:hypothetical protein